MNPIRGPRTLALLGLIVLLGACHPKALPKPGAVVLRPDLKPRREPTLAAHGFARYSGDLRFIRRSMSTRQAHVPGRFETALRTYKNGQGQKVAIVATVHVALGDYYQALDKRLSVFPKVLYEDLKGSAQSLKSKEPGQGKTSEPWSQMRSQQELFQGLGSGDKEGWSRADLSVDDVKAHLAALGEDRFFERTGGGASTKPDSYRVFFHLLGLTLVQNETGVAANDELPRGLYKLGPQDFLEQRPWNMDKVDYALIYRRNDVVLEALKTELQSGQEKVALLYGAAHAFDLQDRLFDLGFVLDSEEWFSAWNLADAP